MQKPHANDETLMDYVTGAVKVNRGAEANRQQVERLLVDRLGYSPQSIEVDAPIEVGIDGEVYVSRVDLVVTVRGQRYMVFKCAAGSLASREREVIAAARLLDDLQIPLAIATDGKTALIWDTVTGKLAGTGLDAIPTAEQADRQFDPATRRPLENKKRRRQALIFRSYDAMNIHR